MEPPLGFPYVTPYIDEISPLVESLLCALQDEVRFLGCRAVGVCDVIQDGRTFIQDMYNMT